MKPGRAGRKDKKKENAGASVPDHIATVYSFRGEKVKMNYYVYYYPDSEPDVAVVEGKSKEDAIKQLQRFFCHVSAEHVFKIDCHRKGYVDGIMIISHY